MESRIALAEAVRRAAVRHYANLTLRTVRRDLKALLQMQLVREAEGGYVGNLEILLRQFPRQALAANLTRSNSE